MRQLHGGPSEAGAQELAALVNHDRMSLTYALARAAGLGFMAVGQGGEQAPSFYLPIPAVTGIEAGQWERVVPDDVVRGSRVARTAIWSGFFATTINPGFNPLSAGRGRTIRLFGWSPQPEAGYALRADAKAYQDMQLLKRVAPETRVGTIGLIIPDETWGDFPNEPGHYESPYHQIASAHLPVRARDLPEQGITLLEPIVIG